MPAHEVSTTHTGITDRESHTDPAQGEACAYVVLTLADQLCGVPVLLVRDVLADQTIAPIPLAPPEIAGNLNLRGRIVTAIDLRARLRLPRRTPGSPCPMSVVTEIGHEFYALQVDQVSEVITLDAASMECNPPTLPSPWAEFSTGIYRIADRLMVILDIGRLLRLDQETAP